MVTAVRGIKARPWRTPESALGLCGRVDLLIVPQITALPISTQDPD